MNYILMLRKGPCRELAKLQPFLQLIRVINDGAAEAAHFGRMAASLGRRGQLAGPANWP